MFRTFYKIGFLEHLKIQFFSRTYINRILHFSGLFKNIRDILEDMGRFSESSEEDDDDDDNNDDDNDYHDDENEDDDDINKEEAEAIPTLRKEPGGGKARGRRGRLDAAPSGRGQGRWRGRRRGRRR